MKEKRRRISFLCEKVCRMCFFLKNDSNLLPKNCTFVHIYIYPAGLDQSARHIQVSVQNVFRLEREAPQGTKRIKVRKIITLWSKVHLGQKKPFLTMGLESFSRKLSRISCLFCRVLSSFSSWSLFITICMHIQGIRVEGYYL